MTETSTQAAARTSLFRNTAVMAIGTLLSRITGLGRTIALAYALGLYPLADAYNQANQTPTMLYELVVGGILSATLIPVFVRHFRDAENGKTSQDDAWRAVSAMFTIVMLVVSALAVVVGLGAGQIIDFYLSQRSGAFAADQKAVATFLLRIFSAQVALYGFISVATALLNVKRRFGPPMFAPVFNNLVLICLFLAVPRFFKDLHNVTVDSDPALLWTLGIGTTAGVGAMALLLVPFVRSISQGQLRLIWEPKHPAVKQVLRLSGWTAGFVVANQVCLAITLVLAGTKVGDTSAMLTAYTFFILPHGIYAVSVMSALQPTLAELWADHHTAEFRKRFVEGVRLILFVMIPAAVGYALLADPLVSLILQRGSFNEAAAHRTSSVLAAMVIGLPGFSLFIYCTRALQAMTDAKAVFWLYVFENGINIALALLLYSTNGVAGLGIAQSIAYIAGSIAALVVVRNRCRGIELANLFDGISRTILATIPAGLCVYLMTTQLQLSPLFEIAVAGSAGCFTFVIAAWLLRVREFQMITRRARGLVKSLAS